MLKNISVARKFVILIVLVFVGMTGLFLHLNIYDNKIINWICHISVYRPQQGSARRYFAAAALCNRNIS